MLAPLPRPSASSGAGESGRASSHGKLSRAHQRQIQREKLLAVVAESRAPIGNRSRIHNPTVLATPSSVNCANRLYQRSAEKQLKQQFIASVATVIAVSIPKLPSIQEHADTDKGEYHGTILLAREVAEETNVDPAEEKTDANLTVIDKGETTDVESN